MSLPVSFRRAAEHDLVAAQRWYEREKRGLGRRFRSYVDEAVERIRRAPDRYPHATDRFRRILVRRPFPYTLYYAVEPARIVVVACLHEKRDAELVLELR